MPGETNPIVPEEYLRERYFEHKVDSRADEIISMVGKEASQPIKYTHELWFSKAKTMLPFLLSTSLGIEEVNTIDVAATIDILWTLSVVVDDIIDADEMRRAKPAAWKIYGKESTYSSAEKCLRATLGHVAKTISPEAAIKCKESVEAGMRSIEEHKNFGFECTREELEQNYIKRDAFFSEAPMSMLATIYPDKESKLRSAGIALETYYLGGQIGNDLDDLFGGAGRTKRFSDVKSGLVTIPLRLMWSDMEELDREKFMMVFGKGELSVQDEVMIDSLLEKYRVFEKSMDLIKEKYSQASETMGNFLDEKQNSVFNTLCAKQLEKFQGYKS
ncbi:hypothetical protein COV87_02720 [Candidatus Roizmanbacteria bacterium CG11_big_fil_rev_8_21_14_0_20_37_16]|uniref:Polyprenyl synthetase n=1 Tax=Candidatus Roizmanbacteria bacterium CG11_big_fil_rev_8_21_14_0_20_37_16 TaxID=1974857 RepID=A0A2H0KJZ9_9BACT|nr:MAG: hypothetical protein COV87_02720 [Candidatus Roizmanbacteria bacterium CG11_big_fil_rev_8_21_14_0_20_37_16]